MRRKASLARNERQTAADRHIQEKVVCDIDGSIVYQLSQHIKQSVSVRDLWQHKDIGEVILLQANTPHLKTKPRAKMLFIILAFLITLGTLRGIMNTNYDKDCTVGKSIIGHHSSNANINELSFTQPCTRNSYLIGDDRSPHHYYYNLFVQTQRAVNDTRFNGIHTCIYSNNLGILFKLFWASLHSAYH